MNKKELVKLICEETEIKKKKCQFAVDTALEVISLELIKGSRVSIENFGEFKYENCGSEIFNDGSFININPPSVKINFNRENISRSDRINRTELTSGVSIKCGFSRQETESILNSMLRNISESFNESKNVKLKSFGEFKQRTFLLEGELKQGIEFTPSKKLDIRINKIYEFLLPAKKIFDKNKLENIYDEFGIKDFIPAEFHSKETDNNSNLGTCNSDKISDEPEKRLISDKLIDLHNEIIKPSKKTDKKNLWG